MSVSIPLVVMKPGISPRHRAAICSVAALVTLCGLVPAATFAAPAPPGAGPLSPRLAELAQPALRAAPPTQQAEALGLADEGAGSLARAGNRVLVEVRFDRGAAAGAGDLRNAGAAVVNVSRRYQAVTVAARPAELRQLAGVPRVSSVRELLRPMTAESTCPSGAVVSEGVQQLRAGEGEDGKGDEARKAFGVDGSGVTVGILSDSFNRATKSVEGGAIATHQPQDVQNGDLPGATNTCPGQSTDVDVLDDSEAEGEDEGRAMAQIVHDVAPGAALAFATAWPDEITFAENIERLAKPAGEGGAEADVIADDVTYFEEPFFQEGPVGVAVTNATEQGASYFSSAGNDNLVNGGRDIASWEAPGFRDAGSCPGALAAFEAFEGIFLNGSHCMDFDPGAGVDTTFGITVAKGATLIADLQWAEPWEGVGTDLDAFLIGPEGSVVSASGGDNPAEGRPFELIGWENETGGAANVQLAINRYGGFSPRLKLALLENGSGVTATEYESSSGGDVVGPTIFGHNGGEDATSVAAISFSQTEAPEIYSSRGPVTHYFGPVSGPTPASPLGSPQVLSKPDLTATDCGVTTFFAFLEEDGKWHFCGTSAAAPHAAGVAALMLSKDPGAGPGQVATAMRESAVPIAGSSPCAVGAGLVEAVGAIQDLLTPESAPPPVCSPPFSPPIEESGSSSAGTGPTAPRLPPPPQTFLRKLPPKVIVTRRRTAKVAIAFGSDQSEVTFLCKVDRGRPHPCPRRYVRRYRVGRHALRVKARNSAGETDASPAVFKFRVKRIGPPDRRFRGRRSGA